MSLYLKDTYLDRIIFTLTIDKFYNILIFL